MGFWNDNGLDANKDKVAGSTSHSLKLGQSSLTDLIPALQIPLGHYRNLGDFNDDLMGFEEQIRARDRPSFDYEGKEEEKFSGATTRSLLSTRGRVEMARSVAGADMMMTGGPAYHGTNMTGDSGSGFLGLLAMTVAAGDKYGQHLRKACSRGLDDIARDQIRRGTCTPAIPMSLSPVHTVRSFAQDRTRGFGAEGREIQRHTCYP